MTSMMGPGRRQPKRRLSVFEATPGSSSVGEEELGTSSVDRGNGPARRTIRTPTETVETRPSTSRIEGYENGSELCASHVKRRHTFTSSNAPSSSSASFFDPKERQSEKFDEPCTTSTAVGRMRTRSTSDSHLQIEDNICEGLSLPCALLPALASQAPTSGGLAVASEREQVPEEVYHLPPVFDSRYRNRRLASISEYSSPSLDETSDVEQGEDVVSSNSSHRSRRTSIVRRSSSVSAPEISSFPEELLPLVSCKGSTSLRLLPRPGRAGQPLHLKHRPPQDLQNLMYAGDEFGTVASSLSRSFIARLAGKIKASAFHVSLGCRRPSEVDETATSSVHPGSQRSRRASCHTISLQGASEISALPSMSHRRFSAF